MYSSTELNLRPANAENVKIDFKKIGYKILSNWILIAVFILISLILGILFIKVTPPSYQIGARILINDTEKSGGIGKQVGALMDLGGLMSSQNSVDNESEVIKTRYLMEQVVKELNLNIIYKKKATFFTRELYNAPFKLVITGAIDTIRDTKILLKKQNLDKILVSFSNISKSVRWGDIINVPSVGAIQIFRNSQIEMDNNNYLVDINSVDERVAALTKQLFVTVTSKQSTIIDLNLNYSIPKKGEDILNFLIKKYTESGLQDKNAIADSTGKFIKERLKVISSELGSVEDQEQQYKQNNKLADMSEQGKLLVQKTGGFSNELAKIETQVTILTDLENYLKDENKNKRVFPTSILPSDMVFSGLMNDYNALLIERDRQLLSLTEQSPIIKNLDNQIGELRRGILANVGNTKNGFLLTRDQLRRQLTSAEGQVKDVPEIEKNYLKLARNKNIKQELYIFLMQKAEETAISKTSNISTAKVIDPPKATFAPVSPKKNVIYVASVLLGLILPICLIFIIDIFKTTILTKDDVSSLTQVPVIGEISHNPSTDNLIVANQGRSAISEQFRALRTNLSFYLKNRFENVILLTSSMSGEGKSFTAINLANILALSGKKVLLMELDLRKPGLSAKLNIDNSIGFSNYTINSAIKLKDIIRPLLLNPNMFIISSGPLPPNPAETLMSEHMPGLMEELKEQFDYIIMDAPPIGIIADAQLLAKYADVTLYLVRQKVTEKDQMNIVEELFATGKMKNLGIVVNDINNKEYGYGYGYGNYGETQTDGFFARLKKTLNF